MITPRSCTHVQICQQYSLSPRAVLCPTLLRRIPQDVPRTLILSVAILSPVHPLCPIGLLGKAKRSRLVVQSTSLEHPYQRSSLRCSEGRGGTIFKSIHHVVGTSLLPTKALFPSCNDLNTIFFSHQKSDINGHQGPSRPKLDFQPMFACTTCVY